jgi:hypothetical protein
MNTPSPSALPPDVEPARDAVPAPAVALIERDALAAANDDAAEATPDANFEQAPDSLWVNPLWAITAALAFLFGLMAMVLATS